MNNHTVHRETIEVTGIVQGVGFRPFVHHLATRHHLAGYVLNSPDGVVIEVAGSPGVIEEFVCDLTNTAPPLSRIIDIRRTRHGDVRRDDNFPGMPSHIFEIRESRREGKPVTLISPDVTVCEDCLSELFNPNDRRHLYPFINCTNCGPRFTIIRDLPYDRPLTTMASFAMCPDCREEYENPRDRRFHAQPNACPVCGPKVRLLDREGRSLPGDPVVGAIELLKAGNVLAIKGLGGFHLAVNAADEDAVMLLRGRKHREEKPLALMTGTSEIAHELVAFDEAGAQIIVGLERPILLAPCREHAGIAEAVAPGNTFLGVMLPYTPLHYLLFFHPEAGGDYASGHTAFRALVMTSGNLSEEPICRDNDEALERLSGIADAFLVHNRDIHVRSDDSVVTVAGGEASFIRRSRGYVPVPVFLPEAVPTVLALGGELKNTICITEGRRAFTSQHIGDLENIATLDVFHEVVRHFKKILELEPRIFAYDLHPRYLSTRYFQKLEDDWEGADYGAVGVQHHHAHCASVLAEHGYDGPVIGLMLDGTGYGLDGSVWGGEVLLATPYTFTRSARLSTVALPGGEAAIREPWRMAFSYLRAVYGSELEGLDLACLRRISPNDLTVITRACESGVNCPMTSSLGRLFDAVASILGIRHTATFEGQAAMMLDLVAAGGTGGNSLPYRILSGSPEQYEEYPVLRGTLARAAAPGDLPSTPGYDIDYRPLIEALVAGMRENRPVPDLARDFHVTVMASLLDVVKRIRGATDIDVVALSGGCWQNRIMIVQFPIMLEESGFRVLTNRLVPVNDGGISLGQAYVAASYAALV